MFNDNALYRVFFIFLMGFLLNVSVYAQTFEIIPEGPIHEAYVTEIIPLSVLEAVGAQPPPIIMELIPDKVYPQTEWIGGYWNWRVEANQFIWVSGIWRRPPPGKLWINGLWKRFTEGWVRIPGFWSSTYANELTYLDEIPPNAIDEEVSEPPSGDFFWMPGYWSYSALDKKYVWVTGGWEKFDQNWVLVPAHYIWRGEGYVFEAAYWDWTLEERGGAYYPVKITASGTEINFKPEALISPNDYLQKIFGKYPNFLYFFQHHYHFHKQDWELSELAPPWWSWPSWWALDWQNQWNLLWWYTHPGYPQPTWLTAELADEIYPASPKMLNRFHDPIQVPFIVTSKGVLTPQEFLDAALSLNKGKFPGRKGAVIFPFTGNQLAKVQERASLKLPDSDLRPMRTILPRKDEKLRSIPFPAIVKEKNASFNSLKQAQVPKKPDLTKVQKPQSPSAKIEPWRPFRIQEVPAERPKKESGTKKIEPIESVAPIESTESKKIEPIKIENSEFTPHNQGAPSKVPVKIYHIHTYKNEYPPTSNQQIRVSSYPQTYRQIHNQTWPQYWYHKQMQEQRDQWFRREQERRRNVPRSSPSSQWHQNANRQEEQDSNAHLKRYPANPLKNAFGPNNPYSTHSSPNGDQKETMHD